MKTESYLRRFIPFVRSQKEFGVRDSYPFMFASDREARVVFVSPHLVTELGIGLRTHPKTSTALFIGCRFSWRHAKRRHLPATAGDVGQAGGAKAREIAGQFSTK